MPTVGEVGMLGIAIFMIYIIASLGMSGTPGNETGHVSGIVKNYQGDNAPYSILNVTRPNGQTIIVTVSCDYYHLGDSITYDRPRTFYLFYPFGTDVRPTSTQQGCTQS